MFKGSFVFSQVFEILNRFEFDKCVSKHQGNYRVKTFSCWEQFIVMTFAQLSFRESLRDIEFCLSGMKTKMYHCGIKGTVARSTLAKANENRSYKIYEDFGQSLIKIALPMYKGENKLSEELKSIIYAFDSTTIDLCMELFPWAKFRQTKSAVKVHVLLNINGSIPEFISITDGKKQDVNLLDAIPIPVAAFIL